MRIIVIGEICEDVFVYGDCDRICPEGPVPVFVPQEKRTYKGMAGNTWENIKNMSSDDDILYGWFQNFSERMVKTRYVDKVSNQILLRTDEKDKCSPIGEKRKHRLFVDKSDTDLLVVSDYNKGFLTDQDLIDITDRSKLSILDTKRKLNQEIIDAYDFIKLNHKELERNCDLLESHDNMKKIVVTMGAYGAKYMGVQHSPPVVHKTFDVSGAGDVFTAGFAYSYASGNDIIDSISIAQKFCSATVQERGTCKYEKNMD